mmetsp:Transcript_11213/g.30314  ORF Transcript_11213/g.30314 Transcript_11213/m.30314 type:complete len:234 (-) Transcript_11213:546-1247(-)
MVCGEHPSCSHADCRSHHLRPAAPRLRDLRAHVHSGALPLCVGTHCAYVRALARAAGHARVPIQSRTHGRLGRPGQSGEQGSARGAVRAHSGLRGFHSDRDRCTLPSRDGAWLPWAAPLAQLWRVELAFGRGALHVQGRGGARAPERVHLPHPLPRSCSLLPLTPRRHRLQGAAGQPCTLPVRDLRRASLRRHARHACARGARLRRQGLWKGRQMSPLRRRNVPFLSLHEHAS